MKKCRAKIDYPALAQQKYYAAGITQNIFPGIFIYPQPIRGCKITSFLTADTPKE